MQLVTKSAEDSHLDEVSASKDTATGIMLLEEYYCAEINNILFTLNK